MQEQKWKPNVFEVITSFLVTLNNGSPYYNRLTAKLLTKACRIPGYQHTLMEILTFSVESPLFDLYLAMTADI